MIYSNRGTSNAIIRLFVDRTSLCRFQNMTLSLPPWSLFYFNQNDQCSEKKELDLLGIDTNEAMNNGRFAFLMSFEFCGCFLIKVLGYTQRIKHEAEIVECYKKTQLSGSFIKHVQKEI